MMCRKSMIRVNDPRPFAKTRQRHQMADQAAPFGAALPASQ